MALWKPKTSKFYYCRFKINDRSFSGSTRKTTKIEAKAFEAEWKKDELRKMEDLGGGKNAGMTFLDAVNGYMEDVEFPKRRMITLERRMDWLVERIGPTTPLSDIDDTVVRNLIKLRAKDHRFGDPARPKVGNATLNQDICIPLSGILDRARGMKVALPWMPKLAKHIRYVKPRQREMTLMEEFRIQEHAGDCWDILEFALLSGLRREELLIRWESVMWENGKIRVKTKGGQIHEVVITPGIRRILEANIRRHDVFVFTVRDEHVYVGSGLPPRNETEQGRPITYSTLYHSFSTIRRNAGVTNLTIHDLRRTAGARKYRLTGDIVMVQLFLNHANVATTLRHYVHVVLDDVKTRITAAELAFEAIKEEMRMKWAA